MEGRVYNCSWKTEDSRFICWVESNPKLKGEGASIQEADLSLTEVIIETTSDFQPLLQYTPELPPSAFDTLFRGIDLVTVEAPNELNSSVVTSSELFENGICPQCQKRKGLRNKFQLKVNKLPSSADGVHVNIRPGNHTIPIFSEDFVSLLSPLESASIELRRVLSEKASHRPFFEILFKQTLPAAFVKGIQQTGWECNVCKSSEPRAFQKYSKSQINYFVVEGELASGIHPCVSIHMPSKNLFCISRTRWEKIIGKAGTKGLVAIPVGIVPKALVNSRPKVDQVSEIIKKYGRF